MNALVNFINEISSNLTIDFDYTLTEKFIDLLKEKIETRISEKEPVFEESVQLNFSGDKGGISGNRKAKHQEWLSVKR